MIKRRSMIITEGNRTVTVEEFDNILWPEMKKTANYFRSKGITHVNIRHFGERTLTKIISIVGEEQKELCDYIKNNQLMDKTVHITMNPIKNESIMKASIGASDIESFDRLLIDVDTVRPKGTSANDQALAAAETVIKDVVKLLKKFGIKNYLVAHSGNGKHIILEGDFENYPKDFPKQLLQAVGFTCDTELAKIDQVTFDPPRVTKVYGCMATKGEASEVMSHRQSYIEEICEDNQPNDLSQLHKWVTSVLAEKNAIGIKNEVQTTKETKNIWIKGNGKLWADSHHFSYKVKAGDTPNTELLIFDKCPMKDHTNNPNGFSIIQSGDFFRPNCLHESHAELTKTELLSKFPLPETAKIDPKAVDHDALVRGQQYDFFPFLLNKNGLTWKQDGKKVQIASAIYISGIRKSLETGRVSYVIRFMSNGYWEEQVVDGDFLQVGMLKKLARFGLEAKANFESQVIDFLVEQKQTVSVNYLHSTMGWKFRSDSAPIFYLYEAYGDDEKKSLLSEDADVPFDLKPIGTYSAWLEMVETEVLGTYMEMMLAVGFASVIFAYLKGTKYPGLTAPIVNLSNKTSTGKSTAQLFGVSMFASPSSAMDSMNATLNSIIATLAGNHGVPYALDELAANTSIDITQLTYIASIGKEKKRMTRKAKLKQQQTFATIVITSSENPLTVFMKNETGIRPRLIDFAGKTWTKNAKSAEVIKEVSTYNHGQAGNKFIKQLFAQGHELILEIFEQEKEILLAELPDSAIKDRVANNYALITTAVQLIIRFLNIPLRYDFIKEELVAIENDSIQLQELEEQSIEERLYEWLVSNGNHFVQLSNVKKPVHGAWGFVQQKSEYVQINILKNRFEETIKSLAKVENPKRIIQELVKKGILFKEGDRNQKRISVASERLVTYEMRLESDYSPYFGYSLPKGTLQTDEDTHYEDETINKLTDQPFNETLKVEDSDLDF